MKFVFHISSSNLTDAGEMKKGIFTYMMYQAMAEGDLPLHASMNQAQVIGEIY
jgi:ATP-dependent phosphoenolpyruvate carboxykinase